MFFQKQFLLAYSLNDINLTALKDADKQQMNNLISINHKQNAQWRWEKVVEIRRQTTEMAIAWKSTLLKILNRTFTLWL